MKKGRKWLAFLLALVLVAGTISTGKLAVTAQEQETETTTEQFTTSKSKTATNLDENYESNVTLSLPSAEETLVTDVVFVLDKSTSTEVVTLVLEMLEDLKEQVDSTNESKVNVGIVIFNKEANVANNGDFYDLTTQLGDINASYDCDDIQTAESIAEAMSVNISSGTNMHAGLVVAQEMLENDTEVDDSRKYLILISDGLTYLFDNNGTTTSIVTRTNYSNGTYIDQEAISAWENKYEQSATIKEITGYDDDITAVTVFLNQIKAWANADGDTYYHEYGTATDESTKTLTTEDILDDDNVYGHANNVETALYLSATLFEELAEKYNCYAIDNATVNGTVSETYKFGPEFMAYLASLTGNGSTVDFSEIGNDILYLLDAGSTVVDVIGYGTDNEGNEYDFDFVDNAENLTLTVGGVTYTTTKVTSGLDENETSRYTFTCDGVTATNGAEAPFVLHYYKNGTDGASDECFVWDINVPVTNFATVQLTYTVVLTNPQTTDGTYGTYCSDGSDNYTELYTNKVATLYPVDSNGNEGDPEEFQKPTVSYTVETTSTETEDTTEPDTETEDTTEPDTETDDTTSEVETETDDTTSVPETGDTTNIWLPMFGLIVALAGLVSIGYEFFKKKIRI